LLIDNPSLFFLGGPVDTLITDQAVPSCMFGRRYNLNCSFGFETERTKYKPGEPVCVTFSQFATDTSYTFLVDVDDVDIKYEDGKAIIRFTMPDHDVNVGYSCRNTMYRPTSGPGFLGFGGTEGEMKVVDDTEKKDEAPLQEGEWVCALCNARNFGKFCCECGSPRPK
jgi:hypothetical protein